MLRSFQIIKEPIHYRIINLLDKKRLSADDLQKILNIPVTEIYQHLKTLHDLEIIDCDSLSPIDYCRINDTFVKENPFFYQMALVQMEKLPIYQEDLYNLQHLVQKSV